VIQSKIRAKLGQKKARKTKAARGALLEQVSADAAQIAAERAPYIARLDLETGAVKSKSATVIQSKIRAKLGQKKARKTKVHHERLVHSATKLHVLELMESVGGGGKQAEEQQQKGQEEEQQQQQHQQQEEGVHILELMESAGAQKKAPTHPTP
jgi:hypothetical protein